LSRSLSYRDALRESIQEAMRADPRVFLMGEDVGEYGGTYAVTKGLLKEFGPERIRDTPLSELPQESLDRTDMDEFRKVVIKPSGIRSTTPASKSTPGQTVMTIE
jgi:hypothetical protein